jgi:zinc transporter 2
MKSISFISPQTFGYRRWEVIAALFSMLSLAFFSILLEAEGIRRLYSMIYSGDHLIEEIDGRVMSAMAFIGVIINVSLAFILGVENHLHMAGDDHHHHDHSNCVHKYSAAQCDEIDADGGVIELGHSNGQYARDEVNGFLQSMTFASCDYHNHHHSHSKIFDVNEGMDSSNITTKCDSISRKVPIPRQNINMHAAYLHVLGDLVQSIAVLVAGLVIMYKPEWKVVDPILSIVFCPLIFYSTFGVIRTSMQILLEGSPTSVNVDELWSDIATVEGVTNVSNLHVWSISHGIVAMTVHARAIHPQTALHTIHELCTRRYSIDHCTIQIEDHSSDRSLESTNTTHFYVPVQGA